MGLDTVVPDVVFTALVPAVAMTMLPARIALRRYSRERALFLVGGTFLAYLAVAVSLIQFYAICGPGC